GKFIDGRSARGADSLSRLAARARHGVAAGSLDSMQVSGRTKTMPAGLHRMCIGLLCLWLAGCTPSATVAHEEKGMQQDGITRGVTIGRYTYTDAPVEARIGRHLYRIPANYFYDQMGPTFQGDVSLRMQWPDL